MVRILLFLKFGGIVVIGCDVYAFLEQHLVFGHKLRVLGVSVVHLVGVADHQTVLVFGATVSTCGQVMKPTL